MSGAAHTPGPWEVANWSPKESGIVARVNGKDMLITGYALKGDAHLISAAPDLYKACESVIPSGVCLTNRNIPDDFTVALDCTMGDLRKMAAALAKARGQ